MILRNWLYYLLKEDGRSGTVNNGVVSYVGTKTPLPNTPSGWQEILLQYERPIDKHGLQLTFSLPLGFVRDGAHIVREALYKLTIEERVFLLIQHLRLVTTDTTYKWLYEYFYKGELDLSQSDDQRDIISVPIIDGGLKKMVDANWATVYEFPMSDPVCVNLLMDGITLLKKGSFVLLDGLEISNELFSQSSFAPLSLINNEGSANGIFFDSQFLENTATATLTERANSPNMFAEAGSNNSGNVILHITGKIVFHCTQNDGGVGFGINLLKSDETELTLFNDAPLVAGQTYSHDIDQLITLSPGQSLHMEMIMSVTGDVKIEFDAESKLSAEFEYRERSTYCKCYRLIDLYKAIIKKITGSDSYAVSTLCETYSDLLITCGDAIRNINDAVLKTSLQDFFKFVDSVLMAGIYVKSQGGNERVELEDRLTYYVEQPDGEAIDLGEVLDLKIQPATDLMANTFKFGHQKQDIEDVNGKYAFNGNNLFSGVYTRPNAVREYNMVSPYKADPYEIELLRINFEGKTTTDDNKDSDVYAIKALASNPIEATVGFSNALQGMFISDASGFVAGQKIRITGSALNDGVYDIASVTSLLITQLIVFFQPVIDETDQLVTIEWLQGGYYTLDRPDFDTLEGVPNDTVFNIPLLTPKRMLLRHGRWLRSMYDGLDSKKISFTSAKDNFNTELLTEEAGVIVDEDKDEILSNLGDIIFRPWYFIFKVNPLTIIPDDLEENPNRSFIFTDEDGRIWRGFGRMLGVAPNDYSLQEIKVLMSPNNDVKLLIH